MSSPEVLQLFMFAGTFALLMLGFPVAFTLGGSAIIFASTGICLGLFDFSYLTAMPERIFGIMTNETLIAVPLFIHMGVVLERSQISENLLEAMSDIFSGVRGGLAVAVCLVGGLLAASTGIVGATVVTMGLISLPTMLKQKYSHSLATGIICSSGTLGQIIPPSIVLIILGDAIGSAHQQAQLEMGNWAPTSVSVGDLFIGALIPGALLMIAYILAILAISMLKPEWVPPRSDRSHVSFLKRRFLIALLAPLGLIIAVLGSILAGIATPTEAASVGCVGAILLALTQGQYNFRVLRETCEKTAEVTTMVFTILIGASLFSLVFRGLGGDESVQSLLTSIKGGPNVSLLVVMAAVFLLGFFLDFFEIVFVIVPLVGPALLIMGFDPVWLGVMIAMNLQTSFLTPPFGFSLFYLRGVAPRQVKTTEIYRGVLPFIAIQIVMLFIMWLFPEIVTWLPETLF